MPAPKKDKKQRAIITITERDDGKFNGTLTFEPSIREKGTNRCRDDALDNIAVRTAHFVWGELKKQQKGHIILTDE